MILKKIEIKINWKDWICKAVKSKFNFQEYETIRSSGESISIGKSNIDEAGWIKSIY